MNIFKLIEVPKDNCKSCQIAVNCFHDSNRSHCVVIHELLPINFKRPDTCKKFDMKLKMKEVDDMIVKECSNDSEVRFAREVATHVFKVLLGGKYE